MAEFKTITVKLAASAAGLKKGLDEGMGHVREFRSKANKEFDKAMQPGKAGNAGWNPADMKPWQTPSALKGGGGIAGMMSSIATWGAGFGIVVGSLVAIDEALDAQAEKSLATMKLAKSVGFSNSGMAAFDAMKAGGAESMQPLLLKMDKMVGDAAMGDSGAVKKIESLGLALDDVVGKSPEVVFQKLADAIAKTPDPAQRVAMAMEAFGKAGADALPFLEKGSDAFRAMQLKQAERGVTNEQMAKDMAEEKRVSNDASQAWQGLKNRYGIDFDLMTPLLKNLTSIMDDDAATKAVFAGLMDPFNFDRTSQNALFGGDGKGSRDQAARDAILAQQREDAKLAKEKANTVRMDAEIAKQRKENAELDARNADITRQVNAKIQAVYDQFGQSEAQRFNLRMKFAGMTDEATFGRFQLNELQQIEARAGFNKFVPNIAGAADANSAGAWDSFFRAQGSTGTQGKTMEERLERANKFLADELKTQTRIEAETRDAIKAGFTLKVANI